MRARSLLPGLVAFGVASAAGAAARADDLTIVVKVAGLRGGVTAREYVSGALVRMSQGAYDTIFDTASGRITQLDMSAKEYYEVSAAEIEAHNRAIRKQARLAQASPPGPVVVEHGATAATVAGQPCDPVTLTSGTLKLEACLARDLDAPAHAEAERLAALLGSAGDAAVQALYAQLRSLGRLPLSELRSGTTGRITTRSRREVVELTRGPVPAATFDVPAGFTRKDSPYKAQQKHAVPLKPQDH